MEKDTYNMPLPFFIEFVRIVNRKYYQSSAKTTFEVPLTIKDEWKNFVLNYLLNSKEVDSLDYEHLFLYMNFIMKTFPLELNNI